MVRRPILTTSGTIKMIGTLMDIRKGGELKVIVDGEKKEVMVGKADGMISLVASRKAKVVGAAEQREAVGIPGQKEANGTVSQKEVDGPTSQEKPSKAGIKAGPPPILTNGLPVQVAGIIRRLIIGASIRELGVHPR